MGAWDELYEETLNKIKKKGVSIFCVNEHPT
jgi:hypothetical protein